MLRSVVRHRTGSFPVLTPDLTIGSGLGPGRSTVRRVTGPVIPPMSMARAGSTGINRRRRLLAQPARGPSRDGHRDPCAPGSHARSRSARLPKSTIGLEARRTANAGRHAFALGPPCVGESGWMVNCLSIADACAACGMLRRSDRDGRYAEGHAGPAWQRPGRRPKAVGRGPVTAEEHHYQGRPCQLWTRFESAGEPASRVASQSKARRTPACR